MLDGDLSRSGRREDSEVELFIGMFNLSNTDFDSLSDCNLSISKPIQTCLSSSSESKSLLIFIISSIDDCDPLDEDSAAGDIREKDPLSRACVILSHLLDSCNFFCSGRCRDNFNDRN